MNESNLTNSEFKLSQTAIDKLNQFEEQLNPAQPEAGPYSPKIIGYGEMSTVFRFDDNDLQSLAFKRMAVFENESEIAPYENNYHEYSKILNETGITTPRHGVQKVTRQGKPILYIYQEMIDPKNIGHKYIQTATNDEAVQLFRIILKKFQLNFERNEAHPEYKLGLDGQISNWALVQKDTDSVVYLDTSTPMIQKDGVEQLDSELFLRICPSYLVWAIRLFFLKDVLTRYYDLRLVIIDLIGNLNKEQRPDLIDIFLKEANQFLAGNFKSIKPVTRKEIDSYYKEDAWIWRIFLAFRQLERFIKTKIQRKEYGLILPGKVKR